ncbi:hypothetical protein NC796_07500 [Aliifodinibius sp. S!AR15-10]|uniref:hypothetical protein n=1 Tax=Aliifodinibius sp. S!AR15-10 TaxID=2950437 RepID=UPI00285D134B|nr:hypothetical protein [Aliifodinibius sp. S!AR15-10]MDR8390977.1 hypothetical protein [Aliifodinibius sp. S!AR15-10]
MKYSFTQLQDIKSDIENFIEQENDLSTKLLFSLRKNLKEIDSNIELIQEDFAQLDETAQKELQEFQQKRLETIKEYDGNIVEQPDGSIQVTNSYELQQNEEFVKETNELANEHKELLTKINQNEVMNSEKAKEKVAEVEWVEVSIDEFPEVVNDLPENFLEFVTS